jgi:hypothetical protein
MTKCHDPELDAVLGELADHGISPEIHLGGRHPKVRWFDAGGRKQITVPRSSSDWRGPKNARALIEEGVE